MRTVTFTLDPALGHHVHLVAYPQGEVVIAAPDAPLVVFDAGPGFPMISVDHGGPLPQDLVPRQSSPGWDEPDDVLGAPGRRTPSAAESAAVFAPAGPAAQVQRRCGDCGTVAHLDPTWHWWSCVGCNAPQQVSTEG